MRVMKGATVMRRRTKKTRRKKRMAAVSWSGKGRT
jgi:hypothetical protein